MKKNSSTIKQIIRDAKKGKMFILVDDGDRENEGDLVIPGSKCNSKNINLKKELEIKKEDFLKVINHHLSQFWCIYLNP